MDTTLLLFQDSDSEPALAMSVALTASDYPAVASDLAGAAMVMRTRSVSTIVLDVNLGGKGAAFLRSQRALGWSGAVFLLADRSEHDSKLQRELGAVLLERRELTPERLVTTVASVRNVPLRAQAGPEGSLALAMEALRLEYGASLPGQIAALRAELEALASAADPAPLVAGLAATAHRLLGTTGSYGFRALSGTIARFEQVLRTSGADLRARLPELLAGVAAMESALVERPAASSAPSSAGRGRVLLVGVGSEVEGRLVVAGRRLLVECVRAVDWHEASQSLAGGAVEAVVVDARLVPELRASDVLRALVQPVPLAVVGDDGSTHERVLSAALGAWAFIGRQADAAACEESLSRLVPEVGPNPCVVLVEDDAQFAEFVRTVLRAENMVVHLVATTEDLVSRLDALKPDVVLLDQHMSGAMGTDLCRAVRLSNRWQRLPILMLTGSSDRSTRLEAFAAGVDDYMQKPILPDELVIRVRSRLRRARQTEAHNDRDTLTGLLNRRAFLQQLDGRVAESRRQARPLVIGMLDLDYFKLVNDQYGHAAGDLVLAALGLLITRRLRAHDLRCRWGGEELAFAFPGCRLAEATAVVEDLRDRFERSDLHAPDGSPLRVTFSAGLAELDADGEDVPALMAAADRRLYRAKSAGRNRVFSTG